MRMRTLAAIAALTFMGAAAAAFPSDGSAAVDATAVHYRTARIDGIDLFYRDSGPADAPAILLLHGFPTSSQMFRNLIPLLSSHYRVIAPDYPGFGHSSLPDHASYPYTFENYANLVDKLVTQLGVTRYAEYVMDYGAPVGFRLAVMHPERVTAFVVQNGNAYEEGFGKFWAPIMAYWKTHGDAEREGIRFLTTQKATHWQYTNGVKDTSLVDPDAETVDQALMDRPGDAEVQLDLFYDYRTNVPLYDQWHAFFRKYNPPTLIVWGQNDEIFIAAGAEPYKRDLSHVEIHMLDTGHFALETHGAEIGALINDFLARNLKAEVHK
jgi:pimeloyl-ACP methyl ester carboxylesterase